MPSDRLQGAGKIGDCGRGGPALPIEKKAKSGLEGFHLDEIGQARKRHGITAHAHQGGGKGTDLPFSVRKCRRPDRLERRLLQQIASGQPVKPALTVPPERFREPVPPGNPVPAAVGNREANLRPAFDRHFRPPPRPCGRRERLVRPFQKRLIELQAVLVEGFLGYRVGADPPG